MDELVEVMKGDQQSLLATAESVLQNMEDALARLEGLIAAERRSLTDSDPRSILEAVQAIEEMLGRMAQLEATWASLTGSCSPGVGSPTGMARVLAAAGGADPSALGRLLAVRHRILDAIARVAESNEANSLLLAGLSRAARIATDRLSQLRRERLPEASRSSEPWAAWRPALDFQA